MSISALRKLRHAVKQKKPSSMTTEWHRIPGYSSYEINREGVVRIAMDAPIAEEQGELIRLDTFVPDKSKPEEVTETYVLRSDTEGFRVIGKSDLLEETFNPQPPDLGYCYRIKVPESNHFWGDIRLYANHWADAVNAFYDAREIWGDVIEYCRTNDNADGKLDACIESLFGITDRWALHLLVDYSDGFRLFNKRVDEFFDRYIDFGMPESNRRITAFAREVGQQLMIYLK